MSVVPEKSYQPCDNCKIPLWIFLIKIPKPTGACVLMCINTNVGIDNIFSELEALHKLN